MCKLHFIKKIKTQINAESCKGADGRCMFFLNTIFKSPTKKSHTNAICLKSMFCWNNFRNYYKRAFWKTKSVSYM